MPYMQMSSLWLGIKQLLDAARANTSAAAAYGLPDMVFVLNVAGGWMGEWAGRGRGLLPQACRSLGCWCQRVAMIRVRAEGDVRARQVRALTNAHASHCMRARRQLRKRPALRPSRAGPSPVTPGEPNVTR